MKFNLNEATLGDVVQQAEQGIDNSEVFSGKGDIEQALDDLLKTNLRQQKHNGSEFVNLLLVGTGGTGKTSRVKAWAEANNIHLVNLDAKTLDITDLGGAIVPDKENTKVIRLATTELDELDKPRSVLFLDEYNRAQSDIRGTLLQLINDHEIADPREDGRIRKFDNMLFTIAAINPPNPNYNTDRLDAAERSRFYQVDVKPDNKVQLDYLNNKYDKELREEDDPSEKLQIEGRKKLANTLLKSRDFKFDTQEDEDRAAEYDGPILNQRTFTKLLELSDGTKEDFLARWNGLCNRDKKPMVERILANYEDVQDKANDVLKQGTESDVFKKKEDSQWDKIKDFI